MNVVDENNIKNTVRKVGLNCKVLKKSDRRVQKRGAVSDDRCET